MPKQCSRCGTEQAIEDFPRNRTRPDGRAGICKACQRAYVRDHYLRNRAYYLAKARRANDLRVAHLKGIIARLKAVPCADCRVQYPPWMRQFDHVRGEKRFNISRHTRNTTEGMLLAEAAKCDVVCSNCHADRTYRRLHARP